MKSEEQNNAGNFARRVLITGAIALAVAAGALMVWWIIDVLLLVFAGVLLAIFLRSLAHWIETRAGWSRGWSLAAVTVALAVLLTGSLWLLAPAVSAQVDDLSQNLPRTAQRLHDRIDDYRWGQWLIEQSSSPDRFLPERRKMIRQATGIFSTTIGAFGGLAIILAIGLYLAAEPRLYKEGFLQLVPTARRDRAREVLEALGSTLKWWLWGKLLGMFVIGVLTTLGLMLLGVPLALTLGIVAALLTFIPNIGPILALVPAVLLALVESPTKALYVVGLYFAIQTVESYLITPMVQRRTISMPPALTITAQVAMSMLLGAMGLVLATPLTAAAMVAVRMLYIEDVLGGAGKKQ